MLNPPFVPMLIKIEFTSLEMGNSFTADLSQFKFLPPYHKLCFPGLSDILIAFAEFLSKNGVWESPMT